MPRGGNRASAAAFAARSPAGLVAEAAAVLAGMRRFCRAPVPIFVSVPARGSAIPILCSGPNTKAATRIMPPAAAQQACTLREGGERPAPERSPSANTRRCQNPRTARGTGSCPYCGDGSADARGPRARRAWRRIAATKRLYSPVPPAMPKPGARKRAGGKRTAVCMPVITRRFCRPAGLGMRTQGARALRHAGLPLPGPEARQAPCARRRVWAGRTRTGTSCPRRGTGQAAGGPAARPLSRAKAATGRGTIGPARAARAPPAHSRSCLVPLGFSCPRPGLSRPWRGAAGQKLFERPQARARGQRRGQAVDAHKARSPGRRHEHEPQGARQRHAGGPCKAVRGPEEPRHRMHRRTGPTSAPQERARVGGLRPMEAAGACFEHPDRRLALIRRAADYNGAAGLGAIKQAGGIRRSSRGFRQGCRSSAPRVLDRLKTAEREF